jgi:hypothetical protein
MAVPIALHCDDPVARLRRIAVETALRKRRPRTSLGLWFASDLITGLLLRVIARQRVNVTTANLPGPREAQRLLGMPVRAVFPVVPLIGNVSLAIGAVSYACRVDIGITADRETYPDLEALVDGIRSELRTLCAAADGESSSSPAVVSSVTPGGGGLGEPSRAVEVHAP